MVWFRKVKSNTSLEGETLYLDGKRGVDVKTPTNDYVSIYFDKDERLLKMKDFSNADGITFDPRVTSHEATTRSIYVATTGSDTTGTGESTNPFATLEKALQFVNAVVDPSVTVSILLGEGSYDFSGSDLVIARTMGEGATIHIKPSATFANRWERVDVGGTITGISDNVFTDATKTWALNAFRGKFMRCLTFTGTPPTTSTDYSFAYLPIISNDGTSLKTAYTTNMVVLTYDIVEPNTVIDFGTNNIILGERVNFYCLDITCGSIVNHDHGKVKNGTGNNYWYNCAINSTATSGFPLGLNQSTIYSSYLAAATTIAIGSLNNACFRSTKSSTSYKCTVSSIISNSVLEDAGATKGYLVSYSSSLMTSSFIKIQGSVEFIGATAALYVFNAIASILMYGTPVIKCTTLTWFLYLASDASLFIEGDTSFLTEPTSGRLTLNKTAEADYYNDPENNIFANAIAPLAKNIYSNQRTTDATPTVIWGSATVAEGEALHVRFTILASDDTTTPDVALYTKEALFFRDAGGNIAQQGATSALTEIEADAAWDADFVVNTTDQTAEIQVTGADATNIYWKLVEVVTRLN